VTVLEEYEKGTTARFETVFRDDDGNAISPDLVNGSRDVQIEIKDLSDGSVVVSSTDMEEVSSSEFRFDWQTTEDLENGEYEVEVKGRFQGNEVVNRDRVKLVRTSDR
jgi:hypothetical protein